MRADIQAGPSDAQIDRLLRALIEADSLADGGGPGLSFATTAGSGRPAITWAASLAVAAALVLALRTPVWVPPHPAPRIPALEIDYQAGYAADASTRIATFRPCSDQDAYALVLFRGWSEDCACLTWRVHEFADGALLARLAAGEPVEITLEIAETPPVEQFIILALARRRGDLPAGSREALRLLDCLNDAAPPSWAGEPGEHYAAAVQTCLPGSAQVVRQPFYVR